ncbi:MAG: hypothetical protein RID11_06540 [Roseovarius sp.]|uniref:hypothetical protein n=1 Tax=Roseovarius sp. TaxID=1486281 RepID=UPI0032EE3676
MHRRVFLSMAGALALAGCGGFRESRVNPRNWFGRSRSRSRATPATATENTNPLIPEREDSIFRRNREVVYEGTLVDQITAMEIERTSDGAIIRVTGLPLRQGAFDVRLVPEDEDKKPIDGVLNFELRAIQSDNMPQGPERARSVHAAVFVSRQNIERAAEIRVRGARNERVSSR